MAECRLAEHPLQKQIADALRFEIAPAGKVSRDGVVWWSIDHANYGSDVPGIRVGRGLIAGIPDLFVLHRGVAHMIEVKAQDGVRQPPERLRPNLLTSASTCGANSTMRRSHQGSPLTQERDRFRQFLGEQCVEVFFDRFRWVL